PGRGAPTVPTLGGVGRRPADLRHRLRNGRGHARDDRPHGQARDPEDLHRPRAPHVAPARLRCVTADATDALREALLERIGPPLSTSGPAVAPDPVNVAMIRHWVDAFDDRNPIYLDDAAAVAAGFDGLVAPPAMLQTWTMARPRIEGIRERGGSADDIDPNTALARLATEGYTATLATNSELEFVRYLRPGDHLTAIGTLDDVSELKATGVGVGYFI